MDFGVLGYSLGIFWEDLEKTNRKDDKRPSMDVTVMKIGSNVSRGSSLKCKTCIFSGNRTRNDAEFCTTCKVSKIPNTIDFFRTSPLNHNGIDPKRCPKPLKSYFSHAFPSLFSITLETWIIINNEYFE